MSSHRRLHRVYQNRATSKIKSDAQRDQFRRAHAKNLAIPRPFDAAHRLDSYFIADHDQLMDIVVLVYDPYSGEVDSSLTP